MEKSQDLLISFLDEFDSDKELYNLTEKEVGEWIIEEWMELHQNGASSKEATSIIIDGNHKWMSIKPQNKIFVYETLKKLNQSEQNHKIIPFLNREIFKIKHNVNEKKNNQLVRA